MTPVRLATSHFHNMGIDTSSAIGTPHNVNESLICVRRIVAFAGIQMHLTMILK